MRMLASQLAKCLESDDHIRPIFQGVFAIDRLPAHVPRGPSLYVINSDKAQNAGQHWFCAYFEGNGLERCEFWDSLGQHPTQYDKLLMKFLNQNSSYLIYNGRCLQSDTTAVCGMYVLYFAHFRARHVPMECILTTDHFVMDTGVNDQYVYNFCWKNFPLPSIING